MKHSNNSRELIHWLSGIKPLLAVWVSAATLMVSPAATISPLPDKVTPVVPDRQDFQMPDRLHLTGWVGMRIEANEANRLVKLDPARLLEGYRKRPGRQSWDGEHVGKWLHAATLAWVNTGDPALRQKLDYVAAELIKCQLDDGYLGTYLDKDRWTEWDVWAHKYNLIGLITYMRYTGNLEPLPTCRRMADLLCQTFGDEPGKRDIIKAGAARGHGADQRAGADGAALPPDRRAALPRLLQIHPPRLGAAQRPEDHLDAAHRQARGQGRQRQGLRDALLPERRAGILPDDRATPRSSTPA